MMYHAAFMLFPSFAMHLADVHRYKGMAASTPASGKAVSPQATGFSQIQGRGLGHGDGGHNMSVMLSWHEKVC
jgi:hypothetical protein